MRKSTQPARHRNGAWQSSNEMGSIRDYGTLPTEHISLKESTFGQAAELKIQLDLNPEEITSYRRFMDETKKILYTEFVYKETPVKILAFASKKEDLLYYEITAENTCLNLTAKVKPAEEKAYRNYNLGGFYFEEERKRNLPDRKGRAESGRFSEGGRKRPSY